MDLKQIQELMQAMTDHGMSKLELKIEGLEISLEKPSLQQDIKEPWWLLKPSMHSAVDSLHFQRPSDAAVLPIASNASIENKVLAEKAIKSPMVGTFYHSPSPDKPAFVKVGDVVSENTVIGIIEAMKVMNEIRAGVSGTVKEVLVANAQAVEYGTSLISLS